MALLDITGGTSPNNTNIIQPAVGNDARSAPTADSFVSAAVAQKLDADLYTAHDTGDNGEGLSGSGNLNHALLQAQQNDLLTQGGQGDGSQAQDITLGSLAAGLTSGYIPLAPAAAQPTDQSAVISDTTGSGSIQTQSAQAAQFMPASTSTKNADTSITGSETIAALPPLTPTSGINGADGTGTNGINGINGLDGQDGQDGRDGRDGIDGTGGGDDCCGCGGISIIDIDIIGPITLVGPVTIGPVSIGPIINGPLLDLGDVNTTITETITTITTIVTNILDPLLQPPPAGGDTDLLVDLGVAELPLLNDILHVPLDVVEQLAGDIDINLGVEGVVQGDATTVSLDGLLLDTALPDIEITLPVTVETLLSDPAGSVEDTLAALPDTVPDTVRDLLGDVTGGLLPPPDGTDSDLTLDTGILPEIHVPLDVVEAVTGDIDLDVTAALDTLGDCGCLTQTVADLLTVDAGGDSPIGTTLDALDDIALWPATPSADLGDTVIDGVLGSVGGSGDGGILAPAGSLGEGLGLLDTGGDGGGSLLGGLTPHLGGGGLGGGLFG